MKLTELRDDVLLEGGMALKGSAKLYQVEARHVIPDIVKKVAEVLGLKPNLVKPVGSAGHKPGDMDLSGDIDIAVQCDARKVENALDKLAHDKQSHRVMKGINVYSFSYKVSGKPIQVDLMPTPDVKFAEWAYRADEGDLKKGLKGSHRNELFFAIAHHANRHVLRKDDSGEPAELERYFYNLSQGLLTGKKTRYSETGKLTRTWRSFDKHLLSHDPEKVSEILFGSNAKTCDSFYGCLRAMNAPKFPYPKLLSKIIETAKEGMRKKGLKVPEDM